MLVASSSPSSSSPKPIVNLTSVTIQGRLRDFLHDLKSKEQTLEVLTLRLHNLGTSSRVAQLFRGVTVFLGPFELVEYLYFIGNMLFISTLFSGFKGRIPLLNLFQLGTWEQSPSHRAIPVFADPVDFQSSLPTKRRRNTLPLLLLSNRKKNPFWEQTVDSKNGWAF